MPSPQNAAQRTFGFCGSITRSVAPWISSVVPLRSVQLVPPLVDSHTPYGTGVGWVVRWLPPRPRTVETNRWFALPGSTAMSVTAWPVNLVDTCVQLTPPLLDL